MNFDNLIDCIYLTTFEKSIILNVHMHITVRSDIMPRPRKCRKVGFIPTNNCFLPKKQTNEEVILNIEEIEALRLSDFNMLDQDEAAKSMDISRGTFQRILNLARYKTADAIINGKIIRIEGGDYELIKATSCCKNNNLGCICGKGAMCAHCNHKI